MNLRDVKPHTLKRIATECDAEFDEWNTRTEGKTFGKADLVTNKDLWRLAFSHGARAILRRVDALKENT